MKNSIKCGRTRQIQEENVELIVNKCRREVLQTIATSYSENYVTVYISDAIQIREDFAHFNLQKDNDEHRGVMITKSEYNPNFRSGRKVALVIGVRNYESNRISHNTINDAHEVRSKLEDMDFEIDNIHSDLTHDDMNRALAKFASLIKQGDTVLFYFSGHSVQWEHQHFLIPKDDRDLDVSNIRTRTISVDQLLDDFNKQHPFVIVFLLDCCRAYSLRHSNVAASYSRERNLHIENLSTLLEMDASINRVVAFAAAPGTNASDGEKEHHSLFTKHLLNHLPTPNKSIQMVMAAVNRGVMTESKLKQIPKTIHTLWNQYVCLNEKNADTPKISANAQWKQKGLTVAGFHGKGSTLDQLDCPCGFILHDKHGIIIADSNNHRIVRWGMNSTHGQLLAGGSGKGNRLDQLSFPSDVILDPDTEDLIICDRGNRRVLQRSYSIGNIHTKVLVDNIHCWALAMDSRKCLYVSDTEKDEVKRYQFGDRDGIVVAGGYGKGDGLNQLNRPGFIAVDRYFSIYVSDVNNHRVMKWEKGAREGIVVAGGNGKGNALNQLCYPQGLFVDITGTLYIADKGNDRIVRWASQASEGTVIVGLNHRKEVLDYISKPIDISFNSRGFLYISDNWNDRITKLSFEYSEQGE